MAFIPAMAFLCVMISCGVICTAGGDDIDSCREVTLIHVVPSSENEELSGWNKTELDVLLSAKELALNYINNRSDLLPGIKLEILDVSTDDCARDSSMQDFVETFKLIVSKQKCVLGIIGLYCSRVTSIVSSILSHDNFGYVQLSASTSPLLRNKNTFPYLYRTISSSVVFNEAVKSMMKQFMWANINLIYDFSDIFFRSTAKDFVKQIREQSNLKLNLFFPIRASGNHEILEDIVKNESRITYFSVTHKESSDILCDAYHHNYSWPQHVYIFVDDSLEEILANTGKCNKEQLLQASEGIILLLYRLKHSGSSSKKQPHINYQEYRQAMNHGQVKEHGMTNFANVLYDQIWAFALALNNSKLNLLSSNANKMIFSRDARATISQKLQTTSFNGASGKFRFTDDSEVLTMIDIVQVVNGAEKIIGKYNPYERKLTLSQDFDEESVPKYYFDVRRDAIPVWLGIVASLCQVTLLVMLILTAAYVVMKRKEAEIKSASVYISGITLFGCFLFVLSFVFYHLETFHVGPDLASVAYCNIESWLLLQGVNLILVSLLFRLLRIFIVFHYAMTIGYQLTDRYLFTYIALTSLIPLFLQVVRTSLYPLKQVGVRRFVDKLSDPHYTEHFYCSGEKDGLWVIGFSLWVGFLLSILLVLAIQTRHVKYSNFKDTKKINAFVFTVILGIATFHPLIFLLKPDLPVVCYVLKSVKSFLIPLACLGLQFFPKVLPVLSQHKNNQH